jgi:flagellar assembly factor FliW
MSQETNKLAPIVLEPMTRTVGIPVNQDNIFTFPEGIPAFEEYKQFVLYCDTQLQPFFFLKSLGVSPEISFVCVDPYLVCPDFRVRIGGADLKALNLENREDAFVFSTVTVREDPREITANLQGPMIINLKNATGKQVICEGGAHDVRYRIWEAINQLKDK